MPIKTAPKLNTRVVVVVVLTASWGSTAATTSSAAAGAATASGSSASSTAACTAGGSAASASASSASAAATLLGSVVDQQRVQRKRVRQDVIPNVGSSDGERVEILRFLVLDGHLDLLEMRVHGHVDSGHRPVDLSPVLQLDRHSLMTQLHQETNELHGVGPLVGRSSAESLKNF